jgi:hypothetical protein
MAVTRIKQFFSRKNRASLVDMGGGYCVSKEFVMGDAELEWRRLKK